MTESTPEYRGVLGMALRRGGNIGAGGKFVYSFTLLISIEFFHVPGMVLGPGGTGTAARGPRS